MKAQEIISGALNTVQAGQHITIESTAEGKQGSFYEMCTHSFEMLKVNKEFGLLDFYPFFFPWWKHSEYVLFEDVEIDEEMQAYFTKLEETEHIYLSKEQKNWYVKKQKVQQEDMLREFPSTVEEAFRASEKGKWLTKQVNFAYENNRIIDLPYDNTKLVHTAWDLGQNDATVIWFFQMNEIEDIHFIDFFKQTDTPLHEIVEMLHRKKYTYGTHIFPHDAKHRDKAGITFEMQALDLGLSGIVLPIHGILAGINLVRMKFSKMWFDKTKCKEGIEDLSNYKKKWNQTIGGYTSEEVHDDASHAASAMRYAVAGLHLVQDKSINNDAEALKNYWG